MEGYYWRLSDPSTGRVIVALCGVSRDADGAPWAVVAIAAHPWGTVAETIVAPALADPRGYGVRAGETLSADASALRIGLDGAGLDVALGARDEWPRRAYGALGAAHWVPGLGQYWHPHLLGARVEGTASIGSERVDLGGWRCYAEKNWGRGFPRRWWWGQAHGFDREDACVAFAGGGLGAGLTASAVVVRFGDELVRLAPPTAIVRTRVGDGRWSIRGRGPRHRVELCGEAHAEPHRLPVPIPAERAIGHGAGQVLAGDLEVEVRRGGRVVFAGTSAVAGLELGERDAAG